MAECSAQPVTCQATRPDLERYLEQSQHGQNTPVFDCYFLPGTIPPRCAACHRLIAEHESGAALVTSQGATEVVFVGQPVDAGGFAGPYPPVVVVSNSPQMCPPVTLPIQVGDTQDVYTASTHRSVVVCLVLVLFVCVAVIISYVVLGITLPDFVIISIMILMVTAFVASFQPATCSFVFDKENRTVQYHHTRYVWRCCCRTTETFRFDEIRGVKAASRDDGSQLTTIKVKVAPSAGVPDNAVDLLQWVDVLEVNSHLAAWQQYLGSLGITGDAPEPWLDDSSPTTTAVNAATVDENGGRRNAW